MKLPPHERLYGFGLGLMFAIVVYCLLTLFSGCVWPGIDTHEKHPVYPTPADAYHPDQP